MLVCSAGVGRSGTLIAMDKLLDEAAETQAIDILKCIEALRLQRMYMVQTWVRHHQWLGWLVEQGLTSHSTQFRSFRRRCFYRSDDPTNSVKALKEGG